MPVRELPAALPHGELSKLFDDVYFVTGSVRAPGPLPVVCSRNMTVVREFEHVLPVHGDAVIGNAKEAYRPVIEKMA